MGYKKESSHFALTIFYYKNKRILFGNCCLEARIYCYLL